MWYAMSDFLHNGTNVWCQYLKQHNCQSCATSLINYIKVRGYQHVEMQSTHNEHMACFTGGVETNKLGLEQNGGYFAESKYNIFIH